MKCYFRGGAGAKLFPCPYSRKVQARPSRDQRLAPRSRVSGQFLCSGVFLHFLLFYPTVKQNHAHTTNWVVGSILLSGPSCSLGYFPFQPVVHNWFIKGRGMYCSVYGKVHIKDPLLLIEKSSLCGGSGFPSKKKCVNVTI